MIVGLGENTSRLRRALGAAVVDTAWAGASRLARELPEARRTRASQDVTHNVPYRVGAAAPHHLDVYRPPEGRSNGRAVLYLHGGGFRVLSKDTHWVFALMFARAGYTVFVPDYRLAPRHPFPAALDDACAAYRWVVDHARSYGADPAQLVVAGESAGANLTLGVAIAACCERSEPFAERVFATGVVPRAIVPACGMLQVSDPWRFGRRKRISPFIGDRLEEVHDEYLATSESHERELADPLVVLEQLRSAPARALPPMYVSVGTADPLLDDTRRLARAARRLGVVCTDRYFEGEIHAYQALVWRKAARQTWRETFEFLDRAFEGSLIPVSAPT